MTSVKLASTLDHFLCYILTAFDLPFSCVHLLFGEVTIWTPISAPSELYNPSHLTKSFAYSTDTAPGVRMRIAENDFGSEPWLHSCVLHLLYSCFLRHSSCIVVYRYMEVNGGRAVPSAITTPGRCLTLESCKFLVEQ